MLVSVERRSGLVETAAQEIAVGAAPVAAPIATPVRVNRPDEAPASSAARTGFVIFSLLALGYGWFLAARQTFIPNEGVGYWIGIAGGSLLLIQLAYPLRKRVKNGYAEV